MFENHQAEPAQVRVAEVAAAPRQVVAEEDRAAGEQQVAELCSSRRPGRVEKFLSREFCDWQSWQILSTLTSQLCAHRAPLRFQRRRNLSAKGRVEVER